MTPYTKRTLKTLRRELRAIRPALAHAEFIVDEALQALGIQKGSWDWRNDPDAGKHVWTNIGNHKAEIFRLREEVRALKGGRQ